MSLVTKSLRTVARTIRSAVASGRYGTARRSLRAVVASIPGATVPTTDDAETWLLVALTCEKRARAIEDAKRARIAACS